jgi:hypothetical protein
VAVVVARERVGSLEALFAAVDAQTRPAGELVVVDTDATPEVRALLERVEAGGARIVRLGENGGSGRERGSRLLLRAQPPLSGLFRDEGLATVEGLARREWERDRGRPNGSAQDLLFEKR